MTTPLNIDFTPEFIFSASRSSGKGGQNVNKVSTKVELQFNYLNSALLNDEQKAIITAKLSAHINNKGILRIVSQKERSQLLNKENAIHKFYQILEKAFYKKKKRIPSKPSRAIKEKRLLSKKIHSEKKSRRRRKGWD